MIEFTEWEIKKMQESPEILRELATIHDIEITMYEPIGFPLTNHRNRFDELVNEAKRLDMEYENAM